MADLTSLTLADYSDRELLLLIEEAGGSDGWATTADVMRALGITGDRAIQCVGGRLAWLKRFGALERENHLSASKWTLTPMGAMIANGQLSQTVTNTLENLRPDQLLLVTRAVAKRTRNAPDVAGHLTRREWRRGADLGIG